MKKYIFPNSFKFTLSEFKDKICDKCDNCNNILALDFYHGKCEIDLCLDCFNKPIEELFTEHEKSHHICNMCEQHIKTGKIHNIEDFDVCYKCWLTLELKNCFLRINKDTCEDLILNERGEMFSIQSLELDVPIEFQKEVNDEDLCKQYIEMVEYIVRPPLPNWNPQGWALISSFEEIPSFDALCSFAIRCHRGKSHQICSIVEDNHGRIAMNIIYQDHLEYLKDLKEWEENRNNDIDSYIEKVKKAFEDDGTCDNEIIMKATNSFAVYTRIKRNLCCYYG